MRSEFGKVNLEGGHDEDGRSEWNGLIFRRFLQSNEKKTDKCTNKTTQEDIKNNPHRSKEKTKDTVKFDISATQTYLAADLVKKPGHNKCSAEADDSPDNPVIPVIGEEDERKYRCKEVQIE